MKRILLFVFIIAFLIRLVTINQMGRTWDEHDVMVGIRYIELVRAGDFVNPYWITYTDAFPFTRYLYGLVSYLDVITIGSATNSVFHFDLTYSRLLSALFSSLGAVLIAFFGSKYISNYVGLTAGIIAGTLPLFIGLGALVTVESIKFFFYSLSFITFIGLFYTKIRVYKLIIVGVLLGFALQTKYTTITLIPTFTILYFLYRKYRTKELTFTIRHLCFIFITSVVTVIILWPMAFLHYQEVLGEVIKQRFSDQNLAPPEYFFGIFLHVPVPYYYIYFLITTPLAILVFFTLGIKKIVDKRLLIGFVLLLWFIVPFIQSFYSLRQNGLRYVIEIYGPLALIAAIGFEQIVKTIGNSKLIHSICFIIFFIYMLSIMGRSHPYFLNYFNILVGGTKTVYQNNLFPVGWWGEGLGDAGRFLEKNAPLASTVGMQINPDHTIYKIPHLKYEQYSNDKYFDYVVTNTFSIQREFFDEYELQEKYMLIYSVENDGVSYARVYKRKDI